MKRAIKASKVDEFLKYHEDPLNYDKNPEGFDKMYEILDKYGNENEDVGDVFERASAEDQDRMINLIKPKILSLKDKEYAKKLYQGALNGRLPDELGYDEYSGEYLNGIKDTIDILFEGGWLNESDFKAV